MHHDREDVSQLRVAAERNANEEILGDKISEPEDDDEGVVDEPKGVQLFDFDAYGRKIGRQKYEATFGSSSESSSSEASSSSESSTSTTSSSSESSGTFEFDDEDFDEIDRLRRERRSKALDPMDRRRMWESSFFINSFMNLETKEQYFFYSITFGHVNRLGPGEYRPLAAPLVVWPLKVFLLPYNQLHNFCITVEQWKISDFSFNSLYASARLTLKEIIDMEPEFQLLLKRRLPGSKRSYEVHKMRVSLQLNEVFDIDMVFDSWWFLPDKKMPPKLQQHAKALSLNVPVQGRSAQRSVARTHTSKNNYWSYAGFFSFRGTLPSLSNQYIVVTVACQFERQWYRPPLQLGVCIMSLKSVTTYPLFRGVVKKLTTNPSKFQQGEIIGNIRCFVRSVGVLGYENVPFRPMQTVAGTALVTQLNLKEQYLVVRVFKCENLPVANADSFSSNPMVKVKWDGMVNSGARRENTLRPVFNQSFYFPVRLLDPRERTSPIFRKFTLPLDLFAKGPLSFEVWDSDDTTSDFLGEADISLHLLWKEGQRDTRSLAVGVEESDEKTRLPDGRPAEFANRDDSDYSGFGDTVLPDDDRVVVPPYEWPYETLVLKRVLELKGSTLPQMSGDKSLLWCEVFFIPPMPEDVEMPPQPVVKNSNDIWMQVERRWNKDFRRWQKMYLQWFPEAPKERRFVSVAEHSQSRLIFPLPSFVVPIAVPAQLAVEGELLHWLSNIAYLFSPKQLRDGEFQRWQSPASLLTTRRGGVNDHAVLLCSCLLGLDYDAYVCKGTIDGYATDHAWVMTRHAGGWVVFWETTNRKRYCLPYRWGYPSKGPPENFKPKESLEEAAEKYWEGTYLEEWFAWIESQAAAAADAARMAAEGATIPDSEIWGEDVAPDERLDPNVVMEEGGILTESRAPAKSKRIAEKVDKAELRKMMQEQLDKLPITPAKDLLKPDSTLSYVPYSSIEVVFNNFQLWGNLQNLHPACITYDFEDLWKWRPLLTEPADPIETDIIIATPIRDKKCQLLAEDLVGNVVEHIRMQRIKNGNDVSFEHREEMLSKLTFYLDLLEFRLHLDEAHNPGPPANHVGWSSFPEEMADANASAKADYDFFDTVQASNAPNCGDGVEPDPVIQGALQMMGDGYNDFQDIFAANPPPGGFYDPFAVTGEGTYVAPEDAARLEGQQGGYLHLQTPTTPSGPPVYQVPLNPVDAASAAMVDYDTEQRRAEQEEARLVKGYMAGGGHVGWFNGPKRSSGGDHVAPSGLRFSVEPQNAACLPCRSCSGASFELPSKTDRADKNHSNKALQMGSASGAKKRWGNRRRTLKALQRMLQQAAAEGFRLLQAAKKQQQAGKATAENRSFFAGTTAAAAVAASGSNYCNGDPSTAPGVPGFSTKTTKAQPMKGAVSVENVAGQDTSTHLLESLAQCSQQLANELEEHILNSGGHLFPSTKNLLSSRVKRSPMRPWCRLVATARKRKQGNKKHQQGLSSMPSIGNIQSPHSQACGTNNIFESVGSSEEMSERKRAHLLLKEDLRRKVYERMEARAATLQAEQAIAEGTANGLVGERAGHASSRQSRIFRMGFESDPPSSHGSFDTASEYGSSDSAPTEAYVSPSSNSRSSSRRSSCSRSTSEGELVEEVHHDSTEEETRKQLHAGRGKHPSRCSSIATAETAARRAKEESASDTSTGSSTSDQPSLCLHRKPGRRQSSQAGFQWLAGYAAEQKSRHLEAMRRQRKPYVTVAMANPEGTLLQQECEEAEGLHQAKEEAQNHSPRVQPAHGTGSSLGSSESVDLEAHYAGSIESERGTLDSLPDSDVCESSAACQTNPWRPLHVYPPLEKVKRRIRSSSNNDSNNVSRRPNSWESILEVTESFPSKKATASADHIELRSRRTEQKDAAGGGERTNEEWRSIKFRSVIGKDAEKEAISSMATGRLKGGISERMQQAYASSLQRARNSVLAGSIRHATATLLSLKGAKGSANSEAPASAGLHTAEPSHISTRVHGPSQSRNVSSGTNSSGNCRSHVTLENPAVVSLSNASENINSAAVSASGSSSHPRRPGVDRIPGEASAGETDKRLFMTTKEHRMMLDIDYDQANRNWASTRNAGAGPPPAPEGMVYNPLTGVNEYSYAVTTTGGQPYGNMALGAIQQISPVGPVPLNKGRLADVRLHGAFRLNPITGEKEMVDGGGMDRVRQFGATDFIDSGASARPNVKADGLPEGFDMNYARQKYEAGVPAGRDPVMPGGEGAAGALQLEAEAKMGDLDPYGDLLEPPKLPPKEYATFDGGVDLAKLGLASGGQTRKVIKKADGTEPSAQQEAGEGSREIEQEPRVPTEWKMPVSSGSYAVEQVAKWNWYYRMEQIYYLWQQNVFPVKPNHVFCGFPIHLATSDSTEIRSYLGGSRRFRRLLDMPVENITYVVTGKCYPLMGGVISTWLFFGAQVPLASSQERKSHMTRIRKPPHTKQRRKPPADAAADSQSPTGGAELPDERGSKAGQSNA